MGDLLREAQEEGATHVQLAVVNGNSSAAALYSSLGFVPGFDLRTILFS
jgi:ribosomal protein S18 acetylase RimI-like enzyme